MLTAKILQYYDYLQDVNYLAEIVNSTSQLELCNTINTLLQSEDLAIVGSTCLLIRDLIQFGKGHPNCQEFIDRYPQSSIVKTLEHLLFSRNHFICKHAIYTLGKTCSYSSVDALHRAFSQLRDTDPLVLPRLIGEMRWLGAENFWESIDSMMSSPVYATRWAVMAVLDEFIDDARVESEIFQHKCRCLDRLRQDANIYVRSESEYEYRLLEFRSEGKKRSRSEYKQQRKALDYQYQPKLCFASVSLRFTNYLCANQINRYSIEELEVFISDIVITNKFETP